MDSEEGDFPPQCCQMCSREISDGMLTKLFEVTNSCHGLISMFIHLHIKTCYTEKEEFLLIGTTMSSDLSLGTMVISL